MEACVAEAENCSAMRVSAGGVGLGAGGGVVDVGEDRGSAKLLWSHF